MSFKVTRNDFITDKEFQEHQQRMQEMAAGELQHNIRMLRDIRNQKIETPCQTFYNMKKSIPLSVFIQVYPFNELVECCSSFNLPELKELETLYNTLDPEYKQNYVDSFNRLQQIIRQLTHAEEVWKARLMYHRGGGKKKYFSKQHSLRRKKSRRNKSRRKNKSRRN